MASSTDLMRSRGAGVKEAIAQRGRTPTRRPERTGTVAWPMRTPSTSGAAVTTRPAVRRSVASSTPRSGGAAARGAAVNTPGRGTGRLHTTVGATALLEEVNPETVDDAQQRRILPKAPELRAVPAARATARRPAQALRSTRWKRRVRTLLAGLLLLGVVLVAFAAIAMHSQLASRQLRLNVLRTDVDTAEREHQRLRLTVAELDTPQQVVSSAYSLGLVGAAEVEFLPTASTMQPPARTAGPTVPDLAGGR